MPICSECKDLGKFVSDPYRPFCKIDNREVDKGYYKRVCDSSLHRNCPAYEQKYGKA